MNAKNNGQLANWIIGGLLFVIMCLAAFGFFYAGGENEISLEPSIDDVGLGAFANVESQEVRDEADSIFDRGVLVQSIDPAGPAAAAGVRRGTIILEMMGEPVDTIQSLFEALEAYDGGETVTLTILNGPNPEEISVTLAADRPFLGINVGDDCNCSFGGFENREIIPDFDFEGMPDGFQFDLDGLVVIGLFPDGPAEAAGLQEGDIITAVNGDPVPTFDALAERVQSADIGDQFELTVERGGDTLELQVALGENPNEPETLFLGVQIGQFDSAPNE